ncbi:ribosomal protein S12 methylthiotransferase RimO [Striga asiatica]|uniref:Ribosomal protein S12 methylthiotransferase RimO n=1 Tax=Striga asiatica TaxID=4170 RepID=A0A5A7R2B8_STRAF|nr:ribosomal protein S12 methylthiotransferase RimO [Striga asiatica]
MIHPICANIRYELLMVQRYIQRVNALLGPHVYRDQGEYGELDVNESRRGRPASRASTSRNLSSWKISCLDIDKRDLSLSNSGFGQLADACGCPRSSRSRRAGTWRHAGVCGKSPGRARNPGPAQVGERVGHGREMRKTRAGRSGLLAQELGGRYASLGTRGENDERGRDFSPKNRNRSDMLEEEVWSSKENFSNVG